jgi:hypothetical protein
MGQFLVKYFLFLLLLVSNNRVFSQLRLSASLEIRNYNATNSAIIPNNNFINGITTQNLISNPTRFSVNSNYNFTNFPFTILLSYQKDSLSKKSLNIKMPLRIQTLLFYDRSPSYFVSERFVDDQFYSREKYIEYYSSYQFLPIEFFAGYKLNKSIKLDLGLVAFIRAFQNYSKPNYIINPNSPISLYEISNSYYYDDNNFVILSDYKSEDVTNNILVENNQYQLVNFSTKVGISLNLNQRFSVSLSNVFSFYNLAKFGNLEMNYTNISINSKIFEVNKLNNKIKVNF